MVGEVGAMEVLRIEEGLQAPPRDENADMDPDPEIFPLICTFKSLNAPQYLNYKRLHQEIRCDWMYSIIMPSKPSELTWRTLSRRGKHVKHEFYQLSNMATT